MSPGTSTIWSHDEKYMGSTDCTRWMGIKKNTNLGKEMWVNLEGIAGGVNMVGNYCIHFSLKKEKCKMQKITKEFLENWKSMQYLKNNSILIYFNQIWQYILHWCNLFLTVVLSKTKLSKK